MGADALLERLQGVRRTGEGRWLARCPAHDDGRASLSVRELPEGRVLVHDFGGCTTDDVLAAAGLDWSALFAHHPSDWPEKRFRGMRAGRTRELCLALGHELTLALIVLGQVLRNHPTLKPEDIQRGLEAQRRICLFIRELENAA